MTKPETSSNDTKTPQEIEIERQLIPRLRFMGLLLLSFSGCALIYSIFFASNTPYESNLNFAIEGIAVPQDLGSQNPSYGLFEIERYNGYIVAICFALVGGICFLIAQKKLKKSAAKPEDQ